MRVEEQSAERLVLVGRPWLLGVALAAAFAVVAMTTWGLAQDGDIAGTLMIGAGLPLIAFAAHHFVRPARLVMDRKAGTVDLSERTVLGTSVRRVALADVRGAAVNRSREGHRPGDRRGSRAVILLDKGHLPLSAAYLGHRPASRAVAAINRWLNA
ncbi:MAG TPA: hypothetical protein PKD10_03650 [Paracoccaceae bacterium]|nr:hypothetical protein [Paracoccaceae bacterium]HMO70862.1 hypothetical protein [Paracoccaceae bacterium]